MAVLMALALASTGGALAVVSPTASAGGDCNGSAADNNCYYEVEGKSYFCTLWVPLSGSVLTGSCVIG